MKNICIVKGMVSIVTPAKNAGKYIVKTIESVLAQTYTNWELLIIDDASLDNTGDIVKKYEKDDGRIKYLKLEKVAGVIAARQLAIDVARGEFVAFLDADDLWLREKLEKQISFMRKNDLEITCTSYEKIDEFGARLGKTVKCVPLAKRNRILWDCPIGNLTVVYNREKIGEVKIPEVEKREDFALWLKLSTDHKFYGIPEVLAQYRVRRGSVSNKKIPLIYYQWMLYRTYLGFGCLRSLVHVGYWCFIKIIGIFK